MILRRNDGSVVHAKPYGALRQLGNSFFVVSDLSKSTSFTDSTGGQKQSFRKFDYRFYNDPDDTFEDRKIKKIPVYANDFYIQRTSEVNQAIADYLKSS